MVDITGKLAGVIGWPIDHSLSPLVHRYWLKKYGIAGYYVPVAANQQTFPRLLRRLGDLGFAGVNLTMPHKRAAMELVDYCDPLAYQVGAINMIIIHGSGKIEGRNTDVFGFAQNLRQNGFCLGGQQRVAVLGAGGAARAVLVGLQQLGFTDFHLVNRTPQKAEALAREVKINANIHSFADLSSALKDAELLVNTTSLGMKGQEDLDIDLSALPPDAAVTDIVYQPLETALLKKARGAGHHTIDGLGMLLHQARPAFEAWFGHDPEVTQELRQAALEK